MQRVLLKKTKLEMTMSKPESITIKNLEAAFAGESMAHIKYRYFAKLARAAGDEETARTFEDTADQEVQHAFSHLDLLYPKDQLTPAKSLEIAIAGETYEYTEMYPQFRHLAEQEGNSAAAKEMGEEITMKTWQCIVCGFIYDEEAGLPEEGIKAGTRWEDIPADWACPECGVGKADFEMVELA